MPLSRFVGRTAELADPRRGVRVRRASGFVPVYGRCRVGKSVLILRLLQEHPGVYFLGKQAPAALQLREFLEEAAVVLGEPLLATASFDGWKSALAAVTDRWKSPDKLVLVLDEFQWTAWASPELPSVLQDLWDRRWRSSGKILLHPVRVLRGLHGARGARAQEPALRPPHRPDPAAAIRLPGGRALPPFLFRGGSRPDLLHLRRGARGTWGASTRDVPSRPTSWPRSSRSTRPCGARPEFLLQEELREVESYFAVLLRHRRRARHAAGHLRGHGSRAEPEPPLLPATAGGARQRPPSLSALRRPAAARHVRFALADGLLRFWFRFVFPNTSYLAQMGPERTLRDRIRPGLDAYLGSCFEGLCREALPHLYARERVTASFELGEYWDKRGCFSVGVLPR